MYVVEGTEAVEGAVFQGPRANLLKAIIAHDYSDYSDCRYNFVFHQITVLDFGRPSISGSIRSIKMYS
jgi:hypothetical protein